LARIKEWLGAYNEGVVWLAIKNEALGKKIDFLFGG
jgi:hypothetical protein